MLRMMSRWRQVRKYTECQACPWQQAIGLLQIHGKKKTEY